MDAQRPQPMNQNPPTPAQQIAQAIRELEGNTTGFQDQTDQEQIDQGQTDQQPSADYTSDHTQIQPDSEPNTEPNIYPGTDGQHQTTQSNTAETGSAAPAPSQPNPGPETPAYTPKQYQPQPELIDGTQIPKPTGWDGMSLEAQMAYVTESAMHLTRHRETTAKRQVQSLIDEAPQETRETLSSILNEALAESPHALSAPLSPKAKQALIDLAYGRMMRSRLPSQPSPVAGERPQQMDSEAHRTMKEATANFPELKELDWGRIAGGSR